MPERIQLKRTSGWRMPPGTVKVDRTTGFGNPYRVVHVKPTDGQTVARPWWIETSTNVWMFATRDEAVAASIRLFTETMTESMKERVRLGLKGKNLACWCKPGAPCHADVLLRIANAPAGGKVEE